MNRKPVVFVLFFRFASNQNERPDNALVRVAVSIIISDVILRDQPLSGSVLSDVIADTIYRWMLGADWSKSTGQIGCTDRLHGEMTRLYQFLDEPVLKLEHFRHFLSQACTKMQENHSLLGY